MPNIGLSLSGGGARAIAHLGVIKALEEEGYVFGRVSGASAGSIVGALYCNGIGPEESLDIIKSVNFFKVLKPALNWRGLLRLESAAALLENYLPAKFEKLKKPLVVSCTNTYKGKVKYFKKGPLIMPLLASCAIPVVFDPVIIKDTPYVDGGILDNLPVTPLKKNCDIIIGVHCNPVGEKDAINNWKELMERSFLLAISATTYHNKAKCDYFIEPPLLANFSVFDFKKAQELFDIGYRHMREANRMKELAKMWKAA